MNEGMNREESRPLTLILSVGGSPQPLATALGKRRPDEVIFVVSDGSDGTPSSKSMVSEKEIPYERAGAAGTPTRTGPGLAYVPGAPPPARQSIFPVPADDPGRVLALVDPEIAKALRKGHRVIVDYTGGTKSMTAGLVMAATAHEGSELQFMQGERRTLRQIEPGTERPVPIPQELIGLSHVFSAGRDFCRQHNYGAAARLLKEARNMRLPKGVKPPKTWNRRLAGWQQWLETLDMWDRFDHRGAYQRWANAHETGEPWADKFEAQGLAPRLAALAQCAGRPSALLAEDLWLNAGRRAKMGQHDDAIARLYRLAEASVQARLAEKFGIDTGHARPADLPEEIREKAYEKTDPKTGDPYYQLGLRAARALLKHFDPEDPLIAAMSGSTPAWQNRRNNSILAHGFTPLDKQAWKEAEAWFRQRRGAMWEELLSRPTAAQLPRELPDLA